jgi:hypothetical protein
VQDMQTRTETEVGNLTPVPWREFLRQFSWQQGEHVTLLGPTGQGKTTLALSILPLRKYVVVCATKPRDPLLDKLRRRGYRVAREWPAPSIYNRIVYWPPYKGMEDVFEQRRAFAHAFRRMFDSGGWTIFVDEGSYVSEFLRLDGELKTIWQQGRTQHISLVLAAQRPAFIPVTAYSSATHLFFWRNNDDVDLRRIGGIGGISSKEIRSIVQTLPKYHVLYVCTRTGEMAITKAEAK